MLHWTLRTLCWMKKANHKRTNIVQIHLFEVPRVVTFIESECWMMVTRPWGKGNVVNYCSMGTEFLFFKRKRVLEMGGGDGYTVMWIYLKHWTSHLKMVEMVSFMLFIFYCQKIPIDGMRKYFLYFTNILCRSWMFIPELFCNIDLNYL